MHEHGSGVSFVAMSLAMSQVELTPPAPSSQTERVYRGRRRHRACEVWVEEAARPGVRWLLGGCPGRTVWGGPAPATCELAWALLRDASGDQQFADDWYWSFAEMVVAAFPLEGFVVRASDIVAWLET